MKVDDWNLSFFLTLLILGTLNTQFNLQDYTVVTSNFQIVYPYVSYTLLFACLYIMGLIDYYTNNIIVT